MNFVKFLRTPFLENTSGRLLLEMKLKDIPLDIPGDRTIPAVTYPGDRGIPAITYAAPCYCHFAGLVLNLSYAIFSILKFWKILENKKDKKKPLNAWTKLKSIRALVVLML